MVASIVKDDSIELFNLLQEMFLDRKLKISPSVIVTIACDSKYAARLLLQARTDEGRSRESLMISVLQFFDVVADPIKKSQIRAIKKYSGKGPLDKIRPILYRSQDLLNCWTVKMVMAVCNSGRSECRRKVEKV